VDDSAERILREATALFAAHGYHGASTRAIAAAAGLNIATVAYHAGGKLDLYRAVFRRVAERERATLAALVSGADEALLADPVALRTLLDRLIDGLLAMTIAHPETPLLWVRRWLERAPEADEAFDAEFAAPVFEPVRELLERARGAGGLRGEVSEPELFLQSFSWMLYGYFVGRPLDGQGNRADPNEPERLAAFKAFLLDYSCRMLDLPRV
jgi:AcrR family transcriptional regulator